MNGVGYAVDMGQPNGAPPPMVAPQPTPFTLQSGVLDGTLNGLPAKLCVMDWRLVTGTVVLMCSPEEMESFGRQLIACAKQAKSGLVLPPGFTLEQP